MPRLTPQHFYAIRRRAAYDGGKRNADGEDEIDLVIRELFQPKRLSRDAVEHLHAAYRGWQFGKFLRTVTRRDTKKLLRKVKAEIKSNEREREALQSERKKQLRGEISERNNLTKRMNLIKENILTKKHQASTLEEQLKSYKEESRKSAVKYSEKSTYPSDEEKEDERGNDEESSSDEEKDDESGKDETFKLEEITWL